MASSRPGVRGPLSSHLLAQSPERGRCEHTANRGWEEEEREHRERQERQEEKVS